MIAQNYTDPRLKFWTTQDPRAWPESIHEQNWPDHDFTHHKTLDAYLSCPFETFLQTAEKLPNCELSEDSGQRSQTYQTLIENSFLQRAHWVHQHHLKTKKSSLYCLSESQPSSWPESNMPSKLRYAHLQKKRRLYLRTLHRKIHLKSWVMEVEKYRSN